MTDHSPAATLAARRHRARRRRRARRPGAARMGQGLGAEPRRGSRRRARSSRCCAGSVSCRPRKTPSWRWSTPSPRRPASRSTSPANRSTTCSRRPRSRPTPAQGPDMFWGLYSLPHLFPQKCVDVTDVADYLGKKYGGWVPTRGDLRQERQQVDRHSGRLQRQRHQLPHRSVEEGRLQEVPEDHRRLPRLCQGDEGARTRRAAWRSATPRATAMPGCTGACGRIGGNLVDENDKVIINSPETEKALEYAKAALRELHPRHRLLERRLQQQGVPGQRGPLDQQRHLDLRRRQGAIPTKKEIADDMNHALWPVGPVGKPTEFHICLSDAGHELHEVSAGLQGVHRLHAGGGQSQPWLADVGRLSHAPRSTPTTTNPVWTADPKLTVCRDAAKRTLTAGGLGSVGEKAAAALADFIVLDMFAKVCTGREDAKDAIRIAERQAQRLYR